MEQPQITNNTNYLNLNSKDKKDKEQCKTTTFWGWVSLSNKTCSMWSGALCTCAPHNGCMCRLFFFFVLGTSCRTPSSLLSCWLLLALVLLGQQQQPVSLAPVRQQLVLVEGALSSLLLETPKHFPTLPGKASSCRAFFGSRRDPQPGR